MQIDKAELYILREQVEHLLALPYFNRDIQNYIVKLYQACDYLINNHDLHPPPVHLYISSSLWRTVQFLAGTSQNDTPYEIVASLEKILGKWIKEDFAIITALITQKNYYFIPGNPCTLLEDFTDVSFDMELIQVALPRFYKRLPLYNVALYHELGHFIDTKFQLSEYVALQDSNTYSFAHLREYFADLFAASYTGDSVVYFMKNTMGPSDESDSHPSSADRESMVMDFINGKGNDLIEAFSNAVLRLVGEEFTINFAAPDIYPSFNNIRPYQINSDEEMHGIIRSGWEYLTGASGKRADSWEQIQEYEAFKIVNDLIEKSIRNYMMESKWRQVK